MGCDIHLRVEKQTKDGWKPAEEMIPNKYAGEEGEPATLPARFYNGRNYDLFAILANVRNGRGFAGCDTGDGFTPIADPRGLPDDVSDEVKEDSEGWGCDGHSHSWFTLAELLAFDWTQTTKKRGWINGPTAERWLRIRQWEPAPEEYCGMVDGRDVQHISVEEMEQRLNAIKARYGERTNHHWAEIEKAIARELGNTYAQAEWGTTYAQSCENFWIDTMPKLLQLCQGKPKNVRIVFWFDS